MLAGSLTEFSIPDIFSLLAATRKTGVLHLTGTRSAGRVWIREGQLAHAVADVTRSALAARLLQGGEVGTDALTPLLRAQASGDWTQMASALSEVGIESGRAADLLHDQVVDAVFDLSRWDEGDFNFEPRPADGTAADAPLIAVDEVVAAVRERAEEWASVADGLPAQGDVLALVGRPPLQAGGTIQIEPASWQILVLVDGVRTVADIVAMTGQGQFVVARRIAGLMADGLLAAHDPADGSALAQQRADELAELEHDLLGAPRPSAPKTAPMAASEVAAAAPTAIAAPATTSDGSGRNGVHLNGSSANGSHVNGSHVNGSHTNGSYTNGALVDGSHVNGADVEDSIDLDAFLRTGGDPVDPVDPASSDVDGGADEAEERRRRELAALGLDHGGAVDGGAVDGGAVGGGEDVDQTSYDAELAGLLDAASDNADSHTPDSHTPNAHSDDLQVDRTPAGESTSDPADETDEREAAASPSEGQDDGQDLLSRLINGVKGA